MHTGHQAVINGAIRIADELPNGLIHALAQAIQGSSLDYSPSARQRLLQLTPQPHYRTLIGDFLDAWHSRAPELGRQSVALALLSAAATANHCADEQVEELIWTGPQPPGLPVRGSSETLAEMIETAQRSLLVVGFAVWNVPALTHALTRAIDRGIGLRFVVEPDEPGREPVVHELVRALGVKAVGPASIYIWPEAGRPANATCRRGALLARCAVADGRVLLVAHTRLSPHGQDLDMDLGILIRGGRLPETVAAHFERLITNGTLRRQ